jgi:hypothetical protein
MNRNVSNFRLKPNIPKEDYEQIVVATWLSKSNIPFYHIPNGGRRNMLEALKFKRMGVKAGIPDICIPVARKGYHGAYGELKRLVGGRVSEAQEYWMEELKRQGYYVFVGKGADEFIQQVKNYLGASI